MHKNYRRKNYYRPRRGRGAVWTKVWYKRNFWRQWRAVAREHIAHDRFDELHGRIPKSILWDIL